MALLAINLLRTEFNNGATAVDRNALSREQTDLEPARIRAEDASRFASLGTRAPRQFPEAIAMTQPLLQGTELSHYRIVSKLGAGGMGEVYRALDTRLHREVAIKMLPAAFAQDTDRLRRFEQEARTTSALNHPNILTAIDAPSHSHLLTFYKESS
jgi:serine/threonine protein kinase